MKTLYTLILILFLAVVANAQNVSKIYFSNTNSVGLMDTNPFIIMPISGPDAYGNYMQTGLPIRMIPNPTNGYSQTNLAVGNYAMTNGFFGTVCFRVFNYDTGSTVHYWNDGTVSYMISANQGFPGQLTSTFVTIIFTNGTSSITYNAVTNALGYIPLRTNQNITISGDVTGIGSTAISATVTNYEGPALNLTTNIALSVIPPLGSYATTNYVNTGWTNSYIAASNLVASATNGLPTTNYVNLQASNSISWLVAKTNSFSTGQTATNMPTISVTNFLVQSTGSFESKAFGNTFDYSVNEQGTTNWTAGNIGHGGVDFWNGFQISSPQGNEFYLKSGLSTNGTVIEAQDNGNGTGDMQLFSGSGHRWAQATDGGSGGHALYIYQPGTNSLLVAEWPSTTMTLYVNGGAGLSLPNFTASSVGEALIDPATQTDILLDSGGAISMTDPGGQSIFTETGGRVTITNETTAFATNTSGEYVLLPPAATNQAVRLFELQQTNAAIITYVSTGTNTLVALIGSKQFGTAQLTNLAVIVPLTNVVSGTGITATTNNGVLTISATGVAAATVPGLLFLNAPTNNGILGQTNGNFISYGAGGYSTNNFIINSTSSGVQEGHNNLVASSANSTIYSSGSGNPSVYNVILGGSNNTMNAQDMSLLGGPAYSSAIVGGNNNNIGNYYFDNNGCTGNFIGGGDYNQIWTEISGVQLGGRGANWNFIAAGWSNSINGTASAIFAGTMNEIDIQATNSAVGGYFGRASNTCVYIWSDGSVGRFNSVTNNTYIIQSSNGVAINTNQPDGFTLYVNGAQSASEYDVAQSRLVIGSTNFLQITNTSAASMGGNDGTYIWNGNGAYTNHNGSLVTNYNGSWTIGTAPGNSQAFRPTLTGQYTNTAGGSPSIWVQYKWFIPGAVLDGYITATNLDARYGALSTTTSNGLASYVATTATAGTNYANTATNQVWLTASNYTATAITGITNGGNLWSSALIAARSIASTNGTFTNLNAQSFVGNGYGLTNTSATNISGVSALSLITNIASSVIQSPLGYTNVQLNGTTTISSNGYVLGTWSQIVTNPAGVSVGGAVGDPNVGRSYFIANGGTAFTNFITGYFLTNNVSTNWAIYGNATGPFQIEYTNNSGTAAGLYYVWPPSELLGTATVTWLTTTNPYITSVQNGVSYANLSNSNYLQTVAPSNYLQSVAASNYLQSVAASNYLQGVSASNYVANGQAAAVTLTNINNALTGNFTGNAAGLTNVNDSTNHFFLAAGANITATQTNTSTGIGYIVSSSGGGSFPSFGLTNGQTGTVRSPGTWDVASFRVTNSVSAFNALSPNFTGVTTNIGVIITNASTSGVFPAHVGTQLLAVGNTIFPTTIVCDDQGTLGDADLLDWTTNGLAQFSIYGGNFTDPNVPYTNACTLYSSNLYGMSIYQAGTNGSELKISTYAGTGNANSVAIQQRNTNAVNAIRIIDVNNNESGAYGHLQEDVTHPFWNNQGDFWEMSCIPQSSGSLVFGGTNAPQFRFVSTYPTGGGNYNSVCVFHIATNSLGIFNDFYVPNSPTNNPGSWWDPVAGSFTVTNMVGSTATTVIVSNTITCTTPGGKTVGIDGQGHVFQTDDNDSTVYYQHLTSGVATWTTSP